VTVPESDLPNRAVPADDIPSASHTGAVPADDLPQASNTPAPSPDLLPYLHPLVERAGKRHGVDPLALATLIGIESSGGRNPGVSSAGAEGVAQITPVYAKQYHVKNPNDPEEAVDAEARGIADLLKHYKGDYRLAAMAYNAGSGTVDSWLAGKVSLPSETIAYGEGFDQGYQRRKRIAESYARTPVDPVSMAVVPKGTLKTVVGRNSPLRTATNATLGALTALSAPAVTGMRYIDAVLGSGQRFVEGIANKQADEGKAPNLAFVSPAEIMHGFGVAFHPFDDRMQEDETRALVNRTTKALGLNPNDKGIKRLLETFAVQLATDPLTYAPILGELKIGGRVADVAAKMLAAVPKTHPVGKLITTAASVSQKISKSQLATAISKVTKSRPELDDKLDTLGKAARLSIEHRYDRHFAKLRADDEKLLSDFPEIRKAQDFSQLSPEAQAAVRHRTQFEAWAYGTPQMRAEVLRDGFVPTAEQAAQFKNPLGILEYTYRKDYEPLLRTAAQKAGSRAPRTALEDAYFSLYGDRGRAAFEKVRTSNRPQTTPFGERFEYRLGVGRSYAQRRMTDRETLEFLRLHPNEWKGTGSPSVLTREQIAAQLSHEAEPLFVPGGPGSEFLDKVGGALRKTQTTSIIGNPLPHGLKNVGELAYISGGPEAFARGLMHAIDLGSAQVGKASGAQAGPMLDRMERLGLLTDYTSDVARGGLFRLPILNLLPGPGQAAVERLENGFRAAMLEAADKLYGPSKTIADEYRKAQYVRDALGDYRNANAIVQAFKAIGGPFVAFRLGIVPGAVSRALRTNRGRRRIESLLRGQEDVNDPNTGLLPHGTQFSLGGPLEDFGRLTNPSKTLDFLTSPSSLGALGEVAEVAKRAAQGRLSPLAESYQLARDYVPGFGPLVGVASTATDFDPYAKDLKGHTGVPWLTLALASLFGTYFQNPSPGSVKNQARAESGEGKTVGRDFDFVQKMLQGLEAR
jgi:hypothetical protein